MHRLWFDVDVKRLHSMGQVVELGLVTDCTVSSLHWVSSSLRHRGCHKRAYAAMGGWEAIKGGLGTTAGEVGSIVRDGGSSKAWAIDLARSEDICSRRQLGAYGGRSRQVDERVTGPVRYVS